MIYRVYLQAIVSIVLTFVLFIFVVPPMVHSDIPYIWVSGLGIFFGWIALCVWFFFIQVGKLIKCVKSY